MVIFAIYIFVWIQQKYIDYIEKNDYKMYFFLYNLYIFCLANMNFALNPSNSVIQKLL